MKQGFIVLLLLAWFFCPAIVIAQTPFSQENATHLLHHLSVEIGPRPMGSPAERRAMKFAVDKFWEYGCDTAFIMPIMKTPKVNTNSGVAIGIKRGTTDRIIVIGGHIDSVEPEVPGANDDGSGTAVVLEASRVLCSEQRKSTLVFCCFGGEEQGLEGSRHFVNNFPDLDKVVMMLQADMANGLGTIDLLLERDGVSAPKWLVRATVEEFYKSGYSGLRYASFFASLNSASGSGAGSDHESFLASNIPAIDLTTEPADPIHTPRDNFENFDPRGLKRTGDVLLRLANRFDDGVPPEKNEQYFLILLGQTPFFFPLWTLSVFIILSLVLGFYALMIMRKQRQQPQPSRKWTALKITLFTFIIVLLAWFSSSFVGFIKGVRHPWLAYPDGYYLLAGLGAFTGGMFAFRLTTIFPITTCAYRQYRTSFILLTAFLFLFSLAGITLSVAPAFALMMLSCSILSKNAYWKIIFLLLSPFWMMRFIFSEWKELIFRTLAIALPSDFVTILIVNSALVLFFTLYLLPFVFASAGLFRSMPALSLKLHAFSTRWASAITLIIFTSAIFASTAIPSYNKLWYRDIHPTFTNNAESQTPTFTVKSSEYLDGITLTYDGVTHTLRGRTTNQQLPVPSSFEPSFVTLSRDIKKLEVGDSTILALQLSIQSRTRPYRIAIEYSSSESSQTPCIIAEFVSTIKNNTKKYEWYSFPDTTLVLPFLITLKENETISENISVIFSELPSGITIEGELCSVIPRMEYKAKYQYIR